MVVRYDVMISIFDNTKEVLNMVNWSIGKVELTQIEKISDKNNLKSPYRSIFSAIEKKNIWLNELILSRRGSQPYES